MFGFVINKLKNRKWLNLCLLMGVALFIALFVCHPMFEKGAGNQILDRLFTDHATQQNEFPARMSREEHMRWQIILIRSQCLISCQDTKRSGLNMWI